MLSRFHAPPRWLFVHITVLFAIIVAAVGSASPVAAATYPLVSIGGSGSNVTSLQYLLRHRGYSQAATGTFGPTTEKNAKAFQRTVPMQPNGIVGPVTWSKLVVEIRAGARSEAVRALQVQLNKHGYQLAVDGSYGLNTQRAAVAFKQRVGLNSHTTVGPLTWQALIGNGSVASGNPVARGAYALPLPPQAVARWRYERPHHDYPAIDVSVSPGTRVFAVRAGTVSYVGGTCGLGIVITADDGALYRYCHFNSRPIAAGTRVATGQVVGYSGNTGNSTGPHLHLDIRYGGVQRCPQRMMLALYDGTSVPHPSTLPTSGCTFIPNW